MMRLIVMGVVAFLLSLGGTTGALVMKGKAHAGAGLADSAHAAPNAAAVGEARAADAAAATPTPEVQPGSDPAAPEPGPSQVEETTVPATDSPTSAAASHQPTTATLPPIDSSAAESSFRQLARIFANMKTGDAVKVMAFMSDDEVQGVLEQLGVRQAATILAALPKERAATLSRRLLHAGPRPATS